MSSAAIPAAAAERALEGLARTEQRLTAAVADGSSALTGPAAETLAAGGKRLRPLLVFCCTPAERAVDDHLVAAAASVELVHMATLVHDDLLDAATLRRGRPTVVAAHGADTAVQVGDFLFARAFGVLATTGSAAAIRALAATAVDLSRGELAQQRAEHDLGLTEDAYLSRCTQKTASLFATACRLGCLLSGVSDDVADRMARFGASVGLAFQIFDDILDFTGDDDATGKHRGADLRDGTVTLPMILAFRDEPALAADVAAARSDADMAALCDRLAVHSGTQAARRRALDFIQDARETLDGPLEGIDALPLAAIADGVVDRYS